MPDLNKPIAIGGTTVKNRIAMAPMTNKQSDPDGTLFGAEIDWLVRRAHGGFGMVITGGYAIAPEGRIWHGQASVYADEHTAPLADLGRQIIPTGTLGIVQLIHGGSRYSPDITQEQGFSASAGDMWREATEVDIEQVIDAHRRAALMVQAAGLSGIEVHAAHGFLPAQFISRTGNVRMDRWGGDLEGRSRFVREVVRTIRGAVPPEFVIGVRLSAEDSRHGIDLHETAKIAGILADDGMDYLHVSLPDALAPSKSDPTRHPLDIIKPALPADVPVLAAGGIWTPDQAAELLDRGADVVALGLAAIFNPEWPTLAQDADWAPARPPFTRRQLAEVAVTAPFIDYLAEGWPGIVDTTA